MSTKTNGDGNKPFLDQKARDMAFSTVRNMLDTNEKHEEHKLVPDWQIIRFLDVCERVKLDPNLRQIWAIPPFRGGELFAMTGLNSKLIIANRTGLFDGFEKVEWCGKDGVWKDVWTSSDIPTASRAIGWRKDRRHPAIFVAKWDEFKGVSDFWKYRQSLMIAKCSKNGSLNELFPDLLADLFAEEETDTIQTYGGGWSPEREQAQLEQRLGASKEAGERLAKEGVGVMIETTKEQTPEASKAATQPIDSHAADPVEQKPPSPKKTKKKEDPLPALDGDNETPNPGHILKVAAEIYFDKPLASIPFERYKQLIRYAKKIDNALQGGQVFKEDALEDAKQIKLRYNQLLAEDPARKPYDLSDLELKA